MPARYETAEVPNNSIPSEQAAARYAIGTAALAVALPVIFAIYAAKTVILPAEPLSMREVEHT
jgi:hypothetical protein